MRFSESNQNSISEKSVVGHFEFFPTYKFLPGRGWLIPVISFEEECFSEKMSSLACLKKSYSIFRKNTDFGHF